MKFEISAVSIVGLLINPHRQNPHRFCLTSLRILSDEEIIRILEVSSRRLVAYQYASQVAYLRVIRRFGEFLQFKSITSLPRSFDDWQRLIVECYAWILGRNEGGSLVSRQRFWIDPFTPWFCMLQEEKVIPVGLAIPRGRLRKQVSRQEMTTRAKSIGENREAVVRSKVTRRAKTLAGNLWDTNDLEYLRQAEAIMVDRASLLHDIADDHWLRLTKDYRTGKNLMRKISREELDSRITSRNWYVIDSPTMTDRVRSNLVTHPSNERSESWALRLMLHILETSDSAECLQARHLVQHGAFSTNFLYKTEGTPLRELRARTALRDYQLETFSSAALCMRFIGLLSPVDIAVACVILIQEHPNLTPQSIIHARLLDDSGDSFFLDTGEGDEAVFSVDKPRAHTRKYAYLTPRAARVLRHVIRATKRVRALLARANHPLARHLFVGSAGRSLGHPDVDARQLTSTSAPSLVRLYPELIEGGLQQGTLDFVKIRATQGILEWFKNGSVRAVSRKLGNSVGVALDCYVPPELVRLWNERILRRFQNVLILLALQSKDRIFAASDLESEEDLSAFLKNIAMEFPRNSSVLGPYVERLVIKLTSPAAKGLLDPAHAASKALLTVQLDAYALALLYAYRELGATAGLECLIEQQACFTGFQFKDVAELANFFHIAAESEGVGQALSETLQLSKLRRIHKLALPRVAELVQFLKNPLSQEDKDK